MRFCCLCVTRHEVLLSKIDFNQFIVETQYFASLFCDKSHFFASVGHYFSLFFSKV